MRIANALRCACRFVALDRVAGNASLAGHKTGHARR